MPTLTAQFKAWGGADLGTHAVHYGGKHPPAWVQSECGRVFEAEQMDHRAATAVYGERLLPTVRLKDDAGAMQQ